MGVHVRKSTIHRLLVNVKAAKVEVNTYWLDKIEWYKYFGWLSGVVRSDLIAIDWTKPDTEIAGEIFSRASEHRRMNRIIRENDYKHQR